MPHQDRSALLAIFLGAVAIRWGYDIALFAAMGREGLMGADSRGYLANAQAMAASISSGTLQSWAWLGSDLSVMPMYPWVLSLNVLLFGSLAPLTTVMLQGVADGGTCLLVCWLATAIDRRVAIPAAVAAMLNPTQIVLSGLLYNDTLFLFFVALFLAGAGAWLRRPSWPAAVTIGSGLGLAALDRIVVAPWVPVLAVALLTARAIAGRLRPSHIAQVATMAAIFGLAVAPILGRNVSVYGAWALTPQGGIHLAQWVVPLVREANDGTPWERGAAEMARRKAERFGEPSDNPFIEARQYAEVGRLALAELGVRPLIKAWTVGAAINLAAPAIIISPPVAQLPRTGFFATRGDTTAAKIFNFLFRSDSATYAWALLLGIAGVGILRLIQLAGVYRVLRERPTLPIAIVLGLWTGFILAANGPIASPKYRLPIEPVLCVLTGAGIRLLRRPHEPHQAAA